MEATQNRTYYVYCHIRKDKNEPFYIGIGIKPNIEYSTKLKEYRRAYCSFKRNKHWYNIVKNTEYDVNILYESDNENIIKSKEIEFIKLYGRSDLKTGTLVNHTDGGDGQLNPSPELRLLMRNRNLGKKASLETKAKKSKAMLGFKHSKETKEKISMALTGKTIPNEVREKISNTLKNYKMTEETKIKLSNAQKERVKNGLFRSDIIKNIKQYDLDGNFIKEWNNTNEIKKHFNIKNITHLCRALSPKYKSNRYRGYIWEI